jgi:hypothetical protein
MKKSKIFLGKNNASIKIVNGKLVINEKKLKTKKSPSLIVQFSLNSNSNFKEMMMSETITENSTSIEPFTEVSTEVSTFPKLELETGFKLCVKGYHMLNADPIKEAVWETINSQVFKYSGIQVISQACGSHSPGCDIETNKGKFSNKSAKYEAKGREFNISSYRMTATTNAENPGTPEEICAEINKRKNFDYYSVILREEIPNGGVQPNVGFKYDWYLIPSDYPAFNPSNFNWVPTIGKRGKNAGKQVGWDTSGSISGVEGSMSITFSMSSQLWVQIKVTEELKQFIMASTTYDGAPPQMDYITLASSI